MRKKLFTNGSKKTPLERSRSGASQASVGSQDSDYWGPLESAFSEENVTNPPKIFPSVSSRTDSFMSSASDADWSEAVMNFANREDSPERDELEDEAFDEKQPLHGGVEDKEKTKRLRKVVKRRIEVARNEANEVSNFQR